MTCFVLVNILFSHILLYFNILFNHCLGCLAFPRQSRLWFPPQPRTASLGISGTVPTASVNFKAFGSHVRARARPPAMGKGWWRGRVGATAQNGPWKGFDLTFTATQLRQALKVSPLGTGGGGGRADPFLVSSLLPSSSRLASPVLYSGPGLELAIRGCLSA